MGAINGHQYSLATWTCQEEALKSALDKAKKYQSRNISTSKAHGVSRQICNFAFELLEKKLKEQFPSKTYEDLLALTLDSRETLFLYDLQEYVEKIILGKDTTNNESKENVLKYISC